MRSLCLLSAALLWTAPGFAQARVESNVVIGMYSGLALLMDVHYPETPNGRAVLVVPGSAFSARLELNVAGLKENPFAAAYAHALTTAGYTVFVPNHRATPRFQYPDPVDDVKRAVRFIRANANRFGIDPQRIAALGGSSGGHLVSMLGTLGDDSSSNDPDPLNGMSARVQAVVALYAPFNLAEQFRLSVYHGVPEALLVGDWITPTTPHSAPQYQRLLEASPITYVTSDDPPFLLFHGDKDVQVPMEQSIAMVERLTAARVPVEFVRIQDGQHGLQFGFPADHPAVVDHLEAIVSWLDKTLP